VPAACLRALRGGEALDFGGYRIDVAYTPGHASHHVTYFDQRTGVACTGDVGGIRMGATPYVLPPTPPPDIDLNLWRGSLDQIARRRPSGLWVTHFGLKTDVEAHLALLHEELDAWGRVSRDLCDTETAEARESRFVSGVAARLAERAGAAEPAYRAAVPLEHCWMGLARYWEKNRGTNPGGSGPSSSRPDAGGRR
jgi:glyoxylase-like metal-dependent hydrolase (beta-lactamase superfamily II)